MFPDYSFHRPELLQQALTRRSYVNDRSTRDTGGHNEPLEFLGDAVIALMTRRRLYEQLPGADEGTLHTLYIRFVSRRALAGMARQLQLEKHLRAGRGDVQQGIVTEDKALEDALEAVAGALFLDGGLAAAEAVLGAMLDTAVAEALAGPAVLRDPKSRLLEWCQAQRVSCAFPVEEPGGPGRPFTVAAVVDGEKRGRGVGRSKAEAERDAAAEALVALGVDGAPESPESAGGAGPAGASAAGAARSTPAIAKKGRGLFPNAKNALLDWARDRGAPSPVFETRAVGPAHLVVFEAWVEVEGQRFGPVTGTKKTAAEVAVAAVALGVLEPGLAWEGKGD